MTISEAALREHCQRNAAQALVDIMRPKYPGLVWEIGVREQGEFRPFGARPAESDEAPHDDERPS